MIDVFGKAIKAFYNGKRDAEITVMSDNFDDDIIPVSYLFRDRSEMPLLEQKALNLSSGRVLDVGCCAGSHSLYLQEQKKLDVTSIDISKGAVEICKERGLTNVFHQSFNEAKGAFDTILLLMNGTGIIGTLQDIPEFFNKLKSLLHENGQVLIDSSDLIYLYDHGDEVHGYYGQMSYRLKYEEDVSKPFDWLFLDKENLTAEANLHGFNCEIIYEGEHFEYLARLTIHQ